MRQFNLSIKLDNPNLNSKQDVACHLRNIADFLEEDSLDGDDFPSGGIEENETGKDAGRWGVEEIEDSSVEIIDFLSAKGASKIGLTVFRNKSFLSFSVAKQTAAKSLDITQFLTNKNWLCLHWYWYYESGGKAFDVWMKEND